MTLSRQTLAVALLAAMAAPAAHAEIVIDQIGGSEISFEGLVQGDSNWYDNDLADLNGAVGANGENSEFSIRRAEIVLRGKGPGNFDWILGYDAASQKSVAIRNTPTGTATTTVNSTGKFLDVNIKYRIGGDANHFLQVGQFKQPNSMEELSSTKNNDFISKAAVTNTFGVARRTGVAYSYGKSDWSLTASYFGRELTRNLAHGSGYGVRGTWAPINDTGNILHFGVAYVNYDTDGNLSRIRARPDADLATVRLVDSGDIRDSDRIATTSIEGMYISGPFKIQAEYYTSDVARLTRSDYTSTGGYVQGLWNLTGETWGYRAGVPTTPLPNEPASGMWQLGLRYDTIDLDDGSLRAPLIAGGAPVVAGILGGKMSTYTAGVNWYWRSNVKLALNYVKVSSSRYSPTARATLDDDPSIIEGRVQFYW
ncbi:MAG: OprO/OprP family phosphate-selective porin [Luteimonas sp.]